MLGGLIPCELTLVEYRISTCQCREKFHRRAMSNTAYREKIHSDVQSFIRRGVTEAVDNLISVIRSCYNIAVDCKHSYLFH